MENLGTSQNETTVNAPGDKAITKYITFENENNVCWLNSSMSLLVHNQTLIKYINKSSKTQILKIIQNYTNAIKILNDLSDSKHIDERLREAKGMLKTVQDSALKYLQPILKFTEGEPDSAFCSLLNLIVEDKTVKEFFDVKYTWIQGCQKCNNYRVKTFQKPIVTLPNMEIFQPTSPISFYQCLVCKAPHQRMLLNFETLPQCLMLHFEGGAGQGELQCNSFEIDDRTFTLTGGIIYLKGPYINHFLTFIRNPSHMWLVCDDLNKELVNFVASPPHIRLENVFILMYESMDAKRTVINRSLDPAIYGHEEESLTRSVNVPVIDLEEETEEDKAETVNTEARNSETGLGKMVLPDSHRPGKHIHTKGKEKQIQGLKDTDLGPFVDHGKRVPDNKEEIQRKITKVNEKDRSKTIFHEGPPMKMKCVDLHEVDLDLTLAELHETFTKGYSVKPVVIRVQRASGH